MSKFKVGDKIKCVNAKGWAGFKVDLSFMLENKDD